MEMISIFKINVLGLPTVLLFICLHTHTHTHTHNDLSGVYYYVPATEHKSTNDTGRAFPICLTQGSRQGEHSTRPNRVLSFLKLLLCKNWEGS